MERIKTHFETLIGAGISNTDWQVFSAALHRHVVPKNTMLLAPDTVENHLSYIAEGVVHHYVPQQENNLTFAFAFAGEFTSAYDSFLSRLPSNYAIASLADTVLWRITYEKLQAVYRETNIGQRIGRGAAETLYLRNLKRELSLRSETAEQRYLNLFTEQPRLIREIPLKYIASYIGVTPQALSRIRRRIS